jgi:hypothetical protein
MFWSRSLIGYFREEAFSDQLDGFGHSAFHAGLYYYRRALSAIAFLLRSTYPCWSEMMMAQQNEMMKASNLEREMELLHSERGAGNYNRHQQKISSPTTLTPPLCWSKVIPLGC